MTQVMLSMCELQDKGKGPYTEISTLLSEYDYPSSGRYKIKSTKCVACLDTKLTVFSGNIVLFSLIINCIHGGTLV